MEINFLSRCWQRTFFLSLSNLSSSNRWYSCLFPNEFLQSVSNILCTFLARLISVQIRCKSECNLNTTKKSFHKWVAEPEQNLILGTRKRKRVVYFPKKRFNIIYSYYSISISIRKQQKISTKFEKIYWFIKFTTL